MANATPVSVGLVNKAGTEDALFLKVLREKFLLLLTELQKQADKRWFVLSQVVRVQPSQ